MAWKYLQSFVRYSFVLAFLGVAPATGQAGSFTLSCAARDMQILMLIELRASDVSEQIIFEALDTVMDARMTCFEGHVQDALSIYDRIADNVAAAQPPRFGRLP